MIQAAEEIRIAGAVIIYNPGDDIIKNILNYSSQFELLIISDNSDTLNPALSDKIKTSDNIALIANGGNIGIAEATNLAANLAIEKNFTHLITLDQDSLIPGNYVRNFYDFMLTVQESSKLAVVSPFHFYPGYTKEIDPATTEISHSIASGILINLIIFRQTGGQDKSFFIDYVDFEYCLRVRKAGYRILRYGGNVLTHSLGNLESREISGRKFTITHHSPLRLYYRTRNRFRVYARYLTFSPFFVIRDLSIFMAELFKILAYETLKIAKFSMILLGFWHFLTGRTGKYQNH